MHLDENLLRRYLDSVVEPAELERHWPRLVARHGRRVRQLGPTHDVRVTALEYFLEIGVLRKPIVVEENAIRDAEALAFRDALTGLFNFRYFEQQLTTELARAERHDAPLCLILLDLDGFKEVNDVFGHSVGNAVLEDVGRMLASGLREGDVVARFGGDEFAILVHQSSERAGLLIAERKRREIEEWFLENNLENAPVRVTASFGVALLGVPRSSSPDLFDDADRALYQAKATGGNRVFLSFAGWDAYLPPVDALKTTTRFESQI